LSNGVATHFTIQYGTTMSPVGSHSTPGSKTTMLNLGVSGTSVGSPGNRYTGLARPCPLRA
jgi:hypothetical protein